MIKLIAVVSAFLLVSLATQRMAASTLFHTREEMETNEKAGPLTKANIDWTIVHLRDDLGGIHNMVIITNGLLAAILAALLL